MSLANNNKRISIDSAQGILSIEIRFPHSAGWVLSRIVVLIVAVVGGGMLASPIQGFSSASWPERALILLFASAVLALEATIVLDSLLRLLGRETIAVKNGTLVLSTELVGMHHSRAFATSEVTEFRLLEHRYVNRGRARVQRKIAFEYRGRQVGTRGNLSREDGEALYAILAPHFSNPHPLAQRGPEPLDEVPE